MGPLPVEAERIAILGAGRSGLATARALAERGVELFLSDHRPLSPQARELLSSLGVIYEEGGHTDRLLRGELIVLSPGVPPELPILEEARRRGVPIWGELELAYRLSPTRRIIAVTGTNGKSTTTRLIGELLRARGHDVVVAGNIGNPFIGELERLSPDTLAVLEVSSFQLETTVCFRPHVAVWLNFAPDHLDRHRSLERYLQAKLKIFANQTTDDFAVVQEELLQRRLIPPLRPKLLSFSAEAALDLQPCEELDLPPHLREDLAAALTAARLVDPGVDLSLIDLEEALAVPHRLEFVAELAGVRFYDDSKATNVAATLAALRSFSEPLVLILGGLPKGESFDPLAQAIAARASEITVLLIGRAAGEIARALERAGYRDYRFIADFEEAVELALRSGRKVCLLSPACASFDMFANYAERGRAFQRAVLSAGASPSGQR